MKKIKMLLLIMLCLIPRIVFASSADPGFPLPFALCMEAFVSPHMTVFVLQPLSNLFGGDNPKSLLKKLFIARIVILLLGDFLISPSIAILDFFAIFIGAFIIVPICSIAKGQTPFANKKSISKINTINIPTPTKKVTGVILKCAACGTEVSVSDKFCLNCGLAMTGNNVKVEQSSTGEIKVPPKVAVTPVNFDSMYSLTEDKMLEEFLNRELAKASVDANSKLIPEDALKRKKILSVIFIVLLFVFISMIFFHFPLVTYVIGAIILIVCFFLTRRYNLMKYLAKEVKARPNEKISNIVMSTKNSFVQDNSLGMLLIGIVIAISLPIGIFWNPRILYEKTDEGYAVRYYTFGVTNFTTATIPEEYNNEDVISLRGNAFSNMPFLKEVTLPDTITEIRGQAFKNDKSLTKVNIPKKLEYLGGGAFYNCTSIKEIVLPDTLTELGGEAFYGATSLEKVKLSENLTEIRGNTFENCTSLEKIEIPDKVTRIGGHAFYGNSSLSEVTLTENSQLQEIGSSAFRMCASLYQITIPKGTYVNERAFKESPTQISYFGEDDDYYNDDYYYYD